MFGPLMPTCCANCEWPMFRIWNRYLLSNLPSPSSPFIFACFAAIWWPAKQDANTIPVLSLYAAGICQERINLNPPLPTCSTGVRGIPASLSAINPDAQANWVVISHAAAIFASIPNSSSGSNEDMTPANCGMSPNSFAASIPTLPSLPLIKRTRFLSSSLCLYSSLTSEMQVSPRTNFSKLPSSNTLSPPGKPSEIPVTTYGSTALSSNFVTRALLCDVGAEVIHLVMSPGVFATVMSQSGSVLHRA